MAAWTGKLTDGNIHPQNRLSFFSYFYTFQTLLCIFLSFFVSFPNPKSTTLRQHCWCLILTQNILHNLPCIDRWIQSPFLVSVSLSDPHSLSCVFSASLSEWRSVTGLIPEYEKKLTHSKSLVSGHLSPPAVIPNSIIGLTVTTVNHQVMVSYLFPTNMAYV